MNVQDNEIKSLLEKYKKFCVYGLSADGSKPSHYVPLHMKNHGWDVVGTYPKAHQQSGFSIYPDLKSVPPDYRKFVDVFRNSEKIPELANEILAVGGIEVVWLQLGITHPEAEKKLEDAGIKVVSNRCLIIEHRRFF